MRGSHLSWIAPYFQFVLCHMFYGYNIRTTEMKQNSAIRLSIDRYLNARTQLQIDIMNRGSHFIKFNKFAFHVSSFATKLFCVRISAKNQETSPHNRSFSFFVDCQYRLQSTNDHIQHLFLSADRQQIVAVLVL